MCCFYIRTWLHTAQKRKHDSSCSDFRDRSYIYNARRCCYLVDSELRLQIHAFIEECSYKTRHFMCKKKAFETFVFFFSENVYILSTLICSTQMFRVLKKMLFNFLLQCRNVSAEHTSCHKPGFRQEFFEGDFFLWTIIIIANSLRCKMFKYGNRAWYLNHSREKTGDRQGCQENM